MSLFLLLSLWTTWWIGWQPPRIFWSFLECMRTSPCLSTTFQRGKRPWWVSEVGILFDLQASYMCYTCLSLWQHPHASFPTSIAPKSTLTVSPFLNVHCLFGAVSWSAVPSPQVPPIFALSNRLWIDLPSDWLLLCNFGKTACLPQHSFYPAKR